MSKKSKEVSHVGALGDALWTATGTYSINYLAWASSLGLLGKFGLAIGVVTAPWSIPLAALGAGAIALALPYVKADLQDPHDDDEKGC